MSLSSSGCDRTVRVLPSFTPTGVTEESVLSEEFSAESLASASLILTIEQTLTINILALIINKNNN